MFKEQRNESKEDMKELRNQTKEDMKSFQTEISRTFAEEQAKANAEMNLKIGSIQNQLATIVDIQKQSALPASDNKAETDTQLKNLEDRFDSFLKTKDDAPKPVVDEAAVQEAVRKIANNPADSTTWKANLAREVLEHEHGVIIHGLRIEGENDAAKVNFVKNFLRDDMKASSDMLNKIRIKDVCRLGSDNGSGKPPPVLVKFGHPSDRNQILPLSKNLKKDKGVSVDKNIPKLYQKTHKEFKRHAWKISLLYNVKTQVIFEGCNLVLRYKKHDDGVTKYNYVTETAWHPQPSDLEASLSASSNKDPSKHDTPALDLSRMAECNKTIIITGVCDSINNTNAKQEFMTYLKSRDHEHLEEVQFKTKGTILVICKDWSGCKHIADTYKKTKFLDKDIFFTMFSETDPSI